MGKGLFGGGAIREWCLLEEGVRCGYKYTWCWTFPRVIPIRERHQGFRVNAEFGPSTPQLGKENRGSGLLFTLKIDSFDVSLCAM